MNTYILSLIINHTSVSERSLYINVGNCRAKITHFLLKIFYIMFIYMYILYIL